MSKTEATGYIRSSSWRLRWLELFGVDLRTLALFRVMLGLYLIADQIRRIRDLSAHYTDFGIMPRSVAIDFLSTSSFSIHLTNGTAAFQAVLFAIAGAAAFAMVLGWRTRLATFVSWFLLLSLQNRNTLILSGEDNLALLLLFWATFLPLGARYSADAALNPSDALVRNSHASVWSAALLIQGMSMYFFSALLKSDPIWFPEGTAVYYALNLDYFATPFAIWFRQFESLLQALTYYVWSLELIGPILMFTPVFQRFLRPMLIVCFVTMHIGFSMCLEIGLFPVISIIMNLTFLPGWIWDRIEHRIARASKRNLTIWYDRDCQFCVKLCRIITTVLFLRSVPIQPAQEDPKIGPLLETTNSWVVTNDEGSYLRWAAMCTLVAASPVFRPLASPLRWRTFSRYGDAVYRLIAENRPVLAGLSDALLPFRKVRLRTSGPSNLLGAAALGFITVQNLATLPTSGIQLPAYFTATRQALGLYQNWTMFAPYPELRSPWPFIRGELVDGTVVDVYNLRLGAPSDERPAVVSSVYANDRWRKFLSNLEDQSYEQGPHRLSLNYARYLCRLWSREMSNEPQLATFAIAFIVEDTSPPGEPKPQWVNTVWHHNCFG